MKSTHRILLIAAALLGFTGVALGAFGAHGLKKTLETVGRQANWETAVLYQLTHAVALLALVNLPGIAVRNIGLCWIGGVLLFSGSLYLLALGAPSKFLWPVTPLGGLLFLAGWLWLAIAAFRRKDA